MGCCESSNKRDLNKQSESKKSESNEFGKDHGKGPPAQTLHTPEDNDCDSDSMDINPLAGIEMSISTRENLANMVDGVEGMYNGSSVNDVLAYEGDESPKKSPSKKKKLTNQSTNLAAKGEVQKGKENKSSNEPSNKPTSAKELVELSVPAGAKRKESSQSHSEQEKKRLEDLNDIITRENIELQKDMKEQAYQQRREARKRIVADNHILKETKTMFRKQNIY